MSIGISGTRKEAAQVLEKYAREKREFLKEQRHKMNTSILKRI